MRWVWRAAFLLVSSLAGFTAGRAPWSVEEPLPFEIADLPEGQCVAELVLASVKVQTVVDAIHGLPEPFPPHLQMQPETAPWEIDAMREVCPATSFDAVDCQEYPCFVVQRGECAGQERMGWSAFPPGSRQLVGADGERTAVRVYARYGRDLEPPPAAVERNRRRRLAYRVDAAIEGVAADLGARPLTALEAAQDDLAAAERAYAEAEAVGFSPEMLARLREDVTIRERYVASLQAAP